MATFIFLIFFTSSIIAIDHSQFKMKTGYIPSSIDLRLHVHNEKSKNNQNIPSHNYVKKVRFATNANGTKVAKLSLTELPNLSNYPTNLIYNQGNLGSCTSNALAYAISYLSKNSLRISRLFQYYHTRYYEALLNKFNPNIAIKQDNGATMIGSLLTIDKYGCTPENVNYTLDKIIDPYLSGTLTYRGWNYIENNFAQTPPPEAYRLALDPSFAGINKGSSEYDSTLGAKQNPYASISQSIKYVDLIAPYYTLEMKRMTGSIKTILSTTKSSLINAITTNLKNGCPIYCGLLFDEQILNSSIILFNNNVNVYKDVSIWAGGHAVCLVGYGNYVSKYPNKYFFKFVNSWGSNWGDKGYGYLDEDCVVNFQIFESEIYAISLDK